MVRLGKDFGSLVCYSNGANLITRPVLTFKRTSREWVEQSRGSKFRFQKRRGLNCNYLKIQGLESTIHIIQLYSAMNRIFRDQLAPNRYFRDFFQNLKQIYEINIFYSCVYLQWLVFRLSPGFDVRQLSYSNIIFFSLYVQVIALLLVFSLVTQVTWVQSLTIALRDFYHLFSCYLILTRSQTFCFGCNFFRLRFI